MRKYCTWYVTYIEPMASEVRIPIVLSIPIVLPMLFPMLTNNSYKCDVTLCSIGISHTEPAHSRKSLLDKLLVAMF